MHKEKSSGHTWTSLEADLDAVKGKCLQKSF